MPTEQRLELQPAGECSLAAERVQDTPALLARLWREATHFALVRDVRSPVDAADLAVPTAELRRLCAAVAPLRHHAEDAWWVSEWPGTESRGHHLWLRGRTAGAPPFPLDARTLWRGWNSWDDLQLYAGRSLLLSVCSHEGFGEVWGSQELFRELGLEPARRVHRSALQVVGRPLAPAVLEALTADAPTP
jgi:hypothetical protein